MVCMCVIGMYVCVLTCVWLSRGAGGGIRRYGSVGGKSDGDLLKILAEVSR